MSTTPSAERMVDCLVTYTLEVEGRFVVIEHVPARVNEETGERFFAPKRLSEFSRSCRISPNPAARFRRRCSSSPRSATAATATSPRGCR